MTTEDVDFTSCQQSRRDHWDAVARKIGLLDGMEAYHERLTQVYRFWVAPGQRILEVGLRLCFFMSLGRKKEVTEKQFSGKWAILTAKKLMVPSSEEVRCEAVQTIIKRMGITKATIFDETFLPIGMLFSLDRRLLMSAPLFFLTLDTGGVY